MHRLIASYLFQNKTCTLPGLGTLSVVSGKAELDFLNNALKAPAQKIIFETKEEDASPLLDYIAAATGSTVMQSIERLGQFCNHLKKNTLANQPATLEGVGDFFTDSSGNVNFKCRQLPSVFTPSVKAERVIHPEAEHQILVGDKETTNTIMTEYYSETPVPKSRWWIWAVILTAVAITAILIYFSNAAATSLFGNMSPLQ